VERLRRDDEDSVESWVVQHFLEIGESARTLVAGNHHGDLVRLRVADRRQLDACHLAEHCGVELAEPS
jgi:hypothetical protein